MKAPDPFDAIVPLLVKEIPPAISKLTKEKLCRAKLWYYDTSAPCCYFLADAMRESYRSALLKDGNIGAIWDDSEPMQNRMEAMIGNDRKSPTFALFASIYALMSDDEDEGFPRLRTMAQQVSMQLNALDWSKHCSVTDDFVVYAQNGTDYGCGNREDMVLSIPKAKRTLLQRRKLLHPDPDE